MPDLAEVTAELDAIYRRAKYAYSCKDLATYMSFFSPDLRYRQLDGKVIDHNRLKRDVRSQFSQLSQVSSTFDREQIEMADGKAIEILRQTASASARVFLVLHRTWDMARRGRYVWGPVDGRWLIEELEVIAETVK